MFFSVGGWRSSSTVRAPGGRLPVQLRSGTRQVAQALVPRRERRSPKNRSVPSTIASGFPDTRLVGSCGKGAGHGPWERMILISPALNEGSAVTLSSAEQTEVDSTMQAAPTAANAMRDTVRLARVVLVIMASFLKPLRAG